MKKTQSIAKAGRRGGALTLILVAIVVLAGISFMLTRSSRTSGNMNREKTILSASEVMRFGDKVKTAVEMMMANGVDVSQISFQNADTGPTYANGTATAETTIFDASGGGVKYAAPPVEWLDPLFSAQPDYETWGFPNNLCVPFVGTGSDGSGTTTACWADGVDNEELMLLLPYISRDLCKQIDQQLNIPLCAGVPCQLATVGEDEVFPYTGSFADGIMITTAGGETARHQEGCYQGAGSFAGVHFYYKVLAAR